MTNNPSSQSRMTLTTPAVYLIRFRGRVDQNWIEYFNSFLVVVSMFPGRAPEMSVRGRVRDQAELLGMLHYLYYQGAALVSVECLGG